MKILHVIPYMHPSAGGPPVVVEELVRQTSKLGHSSEIISTVAYCNGDQEGVLKRLNELTPTALLPEIGSVVPVSGSIRRQVGNSVQAADVVHVHTLWSGLNTVARRACMRHGRPYVMMPHGMIDPYSLSVKSWRKLVYLNAIERRNLIGAKRIIYTSEEEVRLAEEQFSWLPEAAVMLLGGDAPLERADVLAKTFIDRFPRARGRRQLLFLGRLHEKKGIDRIIDVLPLLVRAHPEVLLTIAGGGTPAFEERLKETVRVRGLDESVMFTGRLAGAEKWGAYASAEMFLLPSRQENFAIAVAEAMHMGRPVIISDKVNIWTLVARANAGLVLHDEERIAAELGDSMADLLRDSGRSRMMGQLAQAYARDNLTWAGAAKRILACYQEVVSGSPRVGGNG